ncbi:hypothetical protein [Faecalibacterium sp.]|uniref:hypothetical protein n=1 Tax=Faecalibacterium sp. TaxID=1971605 RepID=UPI0035275C66
MPSDMMLCVISYWVLSGAKRRQIQQLRCCVLPTKLLKWRNVYLKLTRHNGRAGTHGTYINQLWAEALTIYNSGNYKLAFSPAMQETLQAHQQDFMQEDAQAGMIYAFLEDYTGERVCSKQLYAEALGNTNIPAEWETRAICEIMNTGISRGDIQGWQAHKTAKRYPKYGVQKGWERVTSPETGAEDFSEITDAEAKQMGFPF